MTFLKIIIILISFTLLVLIVDTADNRRICGIGKTESTLLYMLSVVYIFLMAALLI